MNSLQKRYWALTFTLGVIAMLAVFLSPLHASQPPANDKCCQDLNQCSHCTKVADLWYDLGNNDPDAECVTSPAPGFYCVESGVICFNGPVLCYGQPGCKGTPQMGNINYTVGVCVKNASSCD